jgi:hypothetical protein
LPNARNWLELRLHGSKQYQVPMDAYGTSVSVYVHGMQIYRELMGGGGGATSSQNSSMYHFGLGAATQADSVVIAYPNGMSRRIYGVAGNQYIDVPYDEAKNAVQSPASTALSHIHGRAVTLGSEWTHADVIDLLGRVIYSSRTSFTLPATVPQGVYFVRGYSASGTVETTKLVVH